LFGELKLDRSTCLALNNLGSSPKATLSGQIANPKGDKVASAKLAIDRQIEQSQVSDAALQLKPDPYAKNVPKPERQLLSHDPAVVPGDQRTTRALYRHGDTPRRIRELPYCWPRNLRNVCFWPKADIP